MSQISLLSAGSNARGQLGTGNLEDAWTFTPCIFLGCSPGVLPSGSRNILQIACGANHTLLLLDRDTSEGTRYRELWGCGDPSRGQLGRGSDHMPAHSENSPNPAVFRPVDIGFQQGYTIKSIAAGWETSYVVLACDGGDDVMVSFGANDFGDLGNHSTNLHRSPYIMTFDFLRKVSASVHERIEIVSVAASVHHVVVSVLLIQGGDKRNIVVGWGTSRHGQLGNIRVQGRVVPYICSPHIICEDLQDHVVDVSVGSQHTLLLHASGHLTALGSNRKAQIAGIDALRSISSISTTWNGSYIIQGDVHHQRILAAGDNKKGQLGSFGDSKLPLHVQFPSDHNIHSLKKVVCGSEHVLCLLSARVSSGTHDVRAEVWGWGWNEHGNLGLGHSEDVPSPTKVWPNLTKHTHQAVDVWAGCGTSWIAVER
ncbi:RCC1/BLIP-II [Panus rudis PR-1116 ss-1]|nr:RCC1/BLIP-II [Panus rudis PR-1116 ss-1]